MKEKIESKISEIVEYICKKSPESITNDDYTILSAELRRKIYEEDMKEKNKKLSEAMLNVIGSSHATY